MTECHCKSTKMWKIKTKNLKFKGVPGTFRPPEYRHWIPNPILAQKRFDSPPGNPNRGLRGRTSAPTRLINLELKAKYNNSYDVINKLDIFWKYPFCKMDLRSDTAQIIEVLHNSTLQKREHWRPRDSNNNIIIVILSNWIDPSSSDPGCDPSTFLTLFFVNLDPKCPNLGKYEFSWKKGLCQFSPILVPYLHAKNQKICRLSLARTAVTDWLTDVCRGGKWQ